MDKEKPRKPLNFVQLAVIKNMLLAKITVINLTYGKERAAKFDADKEAFKVDSAAYASLVASAELTEVCRRPRTYIVATGDHPRVDLDKLQEYITKKFGPPPERPKHFNTDREFVRFPAFVDRYGQNYEIEVYSPFKAQLEALSYRLSVAVLNGSCDGLIEAIEALGK